MCRDNEDKQEGNAIRAIPKEKNKFFQTPARRPRWDVKLVFYSLETEKQEFFSRTISTKRSCGEEILKMHIYAQVK